MIFNKIVLALSCGCVGIQIGTFIFMFNSCYKSLYIALITIFVLFILNLSYFFQSYKIHKKEMEEELNKEV